MEMHQQTEVQVNHPDVPPPKKRRVRRPIDGEQWSVARVAQFLGCSYDKALSWLRDKGVPLHNIGSGRAMLRCDPADVRRAYRGDVVVVTTVDRPAAGIKYVPRHLRPKSAS